VNEIICSSDIHRIEDSLCMYFLNRSIDFKNGGKKIAIDHVVNVVDWIGVCL
jgi:hypothetical protein